jgi:hypothetical protein
MIDEKYIFQGILLVPSQFPCNILQDEETIDEPSSGGLDGQNQH